MEDDFNTADAISAVFELVKFAIQSMLTARAQQGIPWQNSLSCLVKLTDVLGIIVDKKEEILGCRY